MFIFGPASGDGDTVWGNQKRPLEVETSYDFIGSCDQYIYIYV